MRTSRHLRIGGVIVATAWLLAAAACRQVVDATDRDVFAAIEQRQREALGRAHAVEIEDAQGTFPTPARRAYTYAPGATTTAVPADFAPTTQSSAAAPATPASAPTTMPASIPPTTAPVSQRASVFTLTDALAYAQEHRRQYQTAKEDLYLVALALTLERHLWTPIFASHLRTVYGNYGEITDFDQAMRFVADLSMSQRLPYGGEFTAAMISTLIRDVKKTITASEGSQIELGLNVPFLRNAGHVAQEDLIQLERDLTYAVRDFERFRRQQLVDVAGSYFDLSRTKQQVLDEEASIARFIEDFERARALQGAGTGTLLDTQRAEQQMLAAQSRLEDIRESFRAQTDQFKLLMGMPVDEPLGLADLEDVEAVEAQIEAGRYPLLRPPAALDDEVRALDVAFERRLDLLSRTDQIDDAKRGVAVARNALLPDLGWNSTLTLDTDPEHYRLGGFEAARATWRSEVMLSLPLERARERNQLRAAVIDVRRAQRTHTDLAERIRAEVRRAVNRVRLENTSLEIQRRNLEVAEARREFARIQFEDGDISNRDVVEAEDDWRAARNRLNLAKTSRWQALLDFRLATETLLVDDHGNQSLDAALP